MFPLFRHFLITSPLPRDIPFWCTVSLPMIQLVETILRKDIASTIRVPRDKVRTGPRFSLPFYFGIAHDRLPESLHPLKKGPLFPQGFFPLVLLGSPF